jgi:pyruvate formate lyase activating enzyme
MSVDRGRIHSIETLGALDGPGLRCVVFLQGCPLQCQYCHNPDTWDATGGESITCTALVSRIARFQPYFGEHGGVTLSGGEPLLQASFTAHVLQACAARGIHTALDTSGVILNADVRKALSATKLVILDIKHTDADLFQRLTGGSLVNTLNFLSEVAALNISLWVRQVIVPGWNDTAEDIHALAQLLHGIPSLERVELLPYHRLGVEKWRQLGRPYPLADVAELKPTTLAILKAVLKDELPEGVCYQHADNTP